MAGKLSARIGHHSQLPLIPDPLPTLSQQRPHLHLQAVGLVQAGSLQINGELLLDLQAQLVDTR